MLRHRMVARMKNVLRSCCENSHAVEHDHILTHYHPRGRAQQI